jgi:hypothetical protein
MISVRAAVASSTNVVVCKPSHDKISQTNMELKYMSSNLGKSDADRKGISEEQWRNLRPEQKLNWRFSIYVITAITYLIMYVFTGDLAGLVDLPTWISHLIAIYCASCFLVLTAGEREYSSLNLWQRKVISVVWRFWGPFLSLVVGILFVFFLSSAVWKAVVPTLVNAFPKGIYSEELIYLLVNAVFLFSIYKKFFSSGMLVDFFRIPQNIAAHWTISTSTNAMVPLAKMEIILAVYFSVGHIFTVLLLSGAVSFWI